MPAYYNENDPFAAAWLRELIKAGLIAPGEVDERSIEEVKPNDLRGFTQCHFFAGIGVWSYALREAGWPDAAPVWSGSCPCQGFSASGQRGGFSDKRHLWPAWFRLIRECRPVTVFGEQVASKDGLAWLDVVSADMEAESYAIGAADTCAAGFGAPNIRQRLYFVANANAAGRGGRRSGEAGLKSGAIQRFERFCPLGQLGNSQTNGHEGITIRAHREQTERVTEAGFTSSMADTGNAERRAGTVGRNNNHTEETGRDEGAGGTGECSPLGDMGDADNSRSQRQSELIESGGSELPARAPSFTNGFWADAEWIYCRDEKYRPVEPGSFPLAHGVTNRVGRLRGYGNAINAEVAKAFIEAYMSLG